ncbi:hypothetical protein E2C01_042553 [Portunus trituberculatus]|uniref:Uncharacterized protein n=1 Tax=Portunus trituberculatus TaxID=210409 RepID=A0A5B7FTY0_PORTR|nr:hypothetical protein [Portunus trituberculatus]
MAMSGGGGLDVSKLLLVHEGGEMIRGPSEDEAFTEQIGNHGDEMGWVHMSRFFVVSDRSEKWLPQKMVATKSGNIGDSYPTLDDMSLSSSWSRLSLCTDCVCRDEWLHVVLCSEVCSLRVGRLYSSSRGYRQGDEIGHVTKREVVRWHVAPHGMKIEGQSLRLLSRLATSIAPSLEIEWLLLGLLNCSSIEGSPCVLQS